MGKRPRTGHLVSGLGDGNVHNPRTKDVVADDLFRRRGGNDRSYVRGGRSKTFALDEAVYANSRDAGINDIKAESPISWQYSIMALIAMMGFLLVLFLHLVTDHAPNGTKSTRSNRRSSTKHRKKHDGYSDDCQTEDYVGDNSDTGMSASYNYYYPKEPQYPKHRRTTSSTKDSGHNFYFSAEHPNLSSYRGPSNSFYDRTPPKQPQQIATPGRLSEADNSPYLPKPKKLSPVSSFASMGPHSGHHSDCQSDSDSILPLPPGVTRGSQHSSSQINFSPNFELETPKAGSRRISQMPADAPLPPALGLSPEVDPGLDDMPFIPNLNRKFGAPPLPMSVEELHSQMESGNIHHSPTFSSSVPDFAKPPEQNKRAASPPKKPVLQPEPESSDEDSPHKNIKHKRPDLTESTNTSKSLLSTIRFDDLQLEEVIGGGGFGQVWKAIWMSTPVAVKVLTGSAQRVNVSKRILEEFAAEINMLKGMRHPNICLYMGACVDPPNRAIVTEFASNGSLWDALRLPLHQPYSPSDGVSRTAWPVTLYPEQSTPLYPRKGAWPWELVKRVASGAARGMTYLHTGFSPPVLHRDLKSANLLLDDAYNTKVCDFGLSRLKAQERSMTGNCGTVQWMAPEILGNQPYAEPADVFSFGIILWELLTGECPYEGMSAIQCALAVLNRDHRPTIPSWCPPALSSLIGGCVKRDPSKRPTFAQICLALEAMP